MNTAPPKRAGTVKVPLAELEDLQGWVFDLGSYISLANDLHYKLLERLHYLTDGKGGRS